MDDAKKKLNIYAFIISALFVIIFVVLFLLGDSIDALQEDIFKIQDQQSQLNQLLTNIRFEG